MRPLSIVTSVWGDYGQYLTDWADSILAQSEPPQAVAILNAGLDDPRPGRDAIAKLRAGGITARISTTRYRGVGAARNAAVAMTTTPWIMHLDADDTLLPDCIADAFAIIDTRPVEVVSVGAIRDGRPILFPRVSRRWILAGRFGCFSSAVYLRSLWELAPYTTDVDWVDSALWVGFAHQGAEFAPTERPGFVYRQHPDSASHTISSADKRAAYRRLLKLCRQWP